MAKGWAQISGIGVFKIDKTTTKIIDSICAANGIEKKVITTDLSSEVTKQMEDEAKLLGTVKYIYELKKDSFDLEAADFHSKSFKNVRTFYINYQSVSGIDISNIYLTFYRDTLIEFSCPGSIGFIEALNKKYGVPKLLNSRKKTITCQNGFGATFKYEEIYSFSEWKIAKSPIIATEFVTITYPDCKADIYYNFSLSDERKISPINDYEKKLSDKKELEKKKIEDAKLKDF